MFYPHGLAGRRHDHMKEAIVPALLGIIVGLLLYLAHVANQLLEQQRKAEKYLLAASKIGTVLLSGMAIPPLFEGVFQACKALVQGSRSPAVQASFSEMDLLAQLYAQQQRQQQGQHQQ